jgi:uncharacterized delta-60 repeat protein
VTFGFGQYDTAQAVAIQPDGKIVVAGSSDPPGAGKSNFLVVRFNTDGSQDGTFGLFGFNVADFQGGDDYGQALALAPDGKIVVAGAAWNGTRHVFGIARFTTTGLPDAAFDLDGLQTIEWAQANHASAVVVQPDRKILLGGHVDLNFAVARLREDGQPDYGFGPGGFGYNLTDLGGTDYINTLVLAPSGMFYAAGVQSVGGNANFALAEYTPTGALSSCTDFPCFNWPNGRHIIDFGGANEGAYAIDLRSDGRVVAAGCADGKFAWAQVRTSTLLTNIIQFKADFAGPYECAYGVKFTGLSQIMTAGVQEFHGDRNIALARFETAPKPPSLLYVPLVVE